MIKIRRRDNLLIDGIIGCLHSKEIWSACFDWVHYRGCGCSFHGVEHRYIFSNQKNDNLSTDNKL